MDALIPELSKLYRSENVHSVHPSTNNNTSISGAELPKPSNVGETNIRNSTLSGNSSVLVIPPPLTDALKKHKGGNESSLFEVPGDEKKSEPTSEEKKKEESLKEERTKSKVTRTHSTSKGTGESSRRGYDVSFLIQTCHLDTLTVSHSHSHSHSDSFFSLLFFSISRRTSTQSDSSSKKHNSKDDESLRFSFVLYHQIH